MRQGFAGPIYCTPPTRDLMAVMLADSARIQEEDARAGMVDGQAAEQPRDRPSRARDIDLVIDQCVPVGYEQPLDISTSARLRFVDAGHILGSAMVQLTLGHGRPRSTVLPSPATWAGAACRS